MPNTGLLSIFNIRRYLIFLYGVSICFGTFALVGSSRNFSLPFILAILYMASLLPLLDRLPSVLYQYGRFLRLPFIFLVLLYIMNVLYVNEYNVAIISIPLWSCFAMFVFMLIHSTYDRKAITLGIYGFMVGATILSILFTLGIGVYVELGVVLEEGERMSMFGQNQNELGLLMTNGISIVLMVIIFYDRFNLKASRIIAIVPIILMGSLLFASASRAAFVSLLASLIIIIFMHKTKNGFTRFVLLLAGFIGLWYGFQTMAESDGIMYDRIMTTIESGNSSGRSDIWKALLPRTMEHPMFGVGQTGYAKISHESLTGIVNNMYEYGYSPHNVLIEVFAYTGIIGLFVMMLFWWRIGSSAINCYKRDNNLVPLLLILPIIVSIMTGQVLASKVAWLSYAYIITIAFQHKSPNKRLL